MSSEKYDGLEASYKGISIMLNNLIKSLKTTQR
jgi:hypothetical protein